MTSSFQNVVGTPRDAVPDISKTNYLETAPDMTEAVNKQIDDNIKDTKQFFDQMVELEELAASKLSKRLSAIENIIGTVGQIKKKREADEADGFGKIVTGLIEDEIISGSKEYTESKNELDTQLATATDTINKDKDLDEQTKLEYRFGTPTEEIFDRRDKEFIKERYAGKVSTVGDILRSNGSLDSTTAAEHLDFERKALLSFYRNVGFDAKQLGYDPNDPRFIKQLIKLTAPQIKAELKSQRELFKATFREKVIEEEAYTFNTKIIESVKGANVINAAGERSDDTFFKDKGVVQQLAIQKTNGNVRKAEDLAFEISAELVKSGDLLPNEGRSIYQDIPYVDANGKEFRNYQAFIDAQPDGTAFKARAESRVQRLSKAIRDVEKLAVDNENAARQIEANNFVNEQVIPRILDNRQRGIEGLEEGQAGALIAEYRQQPFYIDGVTPIPQILLSYLNKTQTGGTRDTNVNVANKYASRHNETDKLIKKLVARKETEDGNTAGLTDLDIRLAEKLQDEFRARFNGEDNKELDLFEIAEGRGTITYKQRRNEILDELEAEYDNFKEDKNTVKLVEAGVGDVIKLRRQLQKKPELFNKKEAFKSEPVDDLFEYVKHGGQRHPELENYYKALRIRVPDGKGNFRVLSGSEAIYQRAAILGLQDPKTLMVDPYAKILQDFRKENDVKNFTSEQKVFRNMRTGEQQDFKEYLTMLSEKRGGQDANQFTFIRSGNTSSRQNLNSLSGAQVVELAKNGSTNFGMYNLSSDIIKDLNDAGFIDADKPFNEDAQSFAVLSLMAMKANRKSNAIRGAITEDTKDFGKLIKLNQEEQQVVNTVFPNLSQNYFAQFQNLEAEVAKIIISDIEKERLARKGKRAQRRTEDQERRDAGTFRRGR